MFSIFGSKKTVPPPASVTAQKDENLYSFDKSTSNSSNTLSMGAVPRTARLSTAEGGRPMTSVRAAGYSSRGRSAVSSLTGSDPSNQSKIKSHKGRIALDTPSSAEKLPEDLIKPIEKMVVELIEESAFAAERGDVQLALGKAKDAGKKERELSKQREQLNLDEPTNLDLTFAVLLNLAIQYQNCGMYQEALHTYSVLVKNKAFINGGRLRVNMGNIYFKEQQYSQAVKMYRMALDQLPSTNQVFRLKIMKNIGIAFAKMGQYQDAASSFEAIMDTSPEYSTGFNLVLCYFAIGDKEKMKRGFQQLVTFVPDAIENTDEHEKLLNDGPIEDHAVFDDDSLRELSRNRSLAASRYILLAAKLIAPAIDLDIASGYEWMVNLLKTTSNASMAPELEIAKSVEYLKAKEFQKAIDCLKGFEKKDKSFIGTAATNLSFLYFLDKDYENSEHYANVAIENDRYNSKAQTNKGNIYYARGQLSKAREHYQDIVGTDALCTEAMYNLGLVLKKMNNFDDALQWFEKIHITMRNNPEVVYQVADIHYIQGNIQQSLEWFKILLSIVPTEPAVLARMADMYESLGDKSQAFHYYSESFRYYPCDLNVIAWLGAYYVDLEVFEKAVHFFHRAAIIEPNEPKWSLMIASCYRRSGSYQLAYDTYKSVHSKYPENAECLRFLIRICGDLGIEDGKTYKEKLSKLDEQKHAFNDNMDMTSGTGVSDPLPPSFQNIRVPSKQMLSVPSKPDKDLFHEDIMDYLPE